MKMHTIIHDGQLYIFRNTRGENDHIFIARCLFITKNMHRYENNSAYLENLSYIWTNIHFLHVEYDQSVMDEISKLDI